MERFIGVIKIEYQDPESKSEGYVPYLETEESVLYRLYREGILVEQDEIFTPYDGVSVEVEGEINMDSWIKVEKISKIEKIEDNNEVPQM